MKRRKFAAIFAGANLIRARLKRVYEGRTLLLVRLRRAIPVIVICLLLTIILERSGWLRSFESAALDTFILLREPLEAKNVSIIGISERDYEEIFGRTDPLDSEKLHHILEAIAKGHPAVIGVDIEPSSANVRSGQSFPGSPPIVWAAQGKAVDSGNGLWQHLLTLISSPDPSFEIKEVPTPAGQHVLSGLGFFPVDSDGAVRRYRRQLKTTNPAIPTVDSFPWAIINEYRKQAGAATNESNEGWVMNFAVDDYSFQPTTIKTLMDVSEQPGWQGENGFIKDKIVLLGGYFPASRDQVNTPTGPKYGVELWAYAIESDLQGKSIRPPSRYLVWLGEILVGLMLVFIHTRPGNRRKSLRYSLIAVPLLALLASFFVFSSFALWALFLPTLMVILIQQLYEDIQDFRKRKVLEMYDHAGTFGQDVRQMLKGFRDDARSDSALPVESLPVIEPAPAKTEVIDQPARKTKAKPRQRKLSKRSRKRR